MPVGLEDVSKLPAALRRADPAGLERRRPEEARRAEPPAGDAGSGAHRRAAAEGAAALHDDDRADAAPNVTLNGVKGTIEHGPLRCAQGDIGGDFVSRFLTTSTPNATAITAKANHCIA